MLSMFCKNGRTERAMLHVGFESKVVLTDRLFTCIKAPSTVAEVS
jgi:hypothetical protein